jgi:hypothetical protein
MSLRISLTGLIPPHFCTCPKPDPRFPMSYSLLFGFLLKYTFKLFGLQIFWLWAYLMKVSTETYLVKVSTETYLMKVSTETYLMKVSTETYLMKVSTETYLMKVSTETYLMKVSKETRRTHLIWYLRFYSGPVEGGSILSAADQHKVWPCARHWYLIFTSSTHSLAPCQGVVLIYKIILY